MQAMGVQVMWDRIKTTAGNAWDRLGRRGRLAVGTVLFVFGTVTPMTFPIQVTGLAIMVKESETVQGWVARARARFPKASDWLSEKLSGPKIPAFLREMNRITDPGHPAAEAGRAGTRPAAAARLTFHRREAARSAGIDQDAPGVDVGPARPAAVRSAARKGKAPADHVPAAMVLAAKGRER